jgi:hypothetical protein
MIGGAGGAAVSKMLAKGVEIAPETRFTYKLTQAAVISYQAPPPPVTPSLVAAAMVEPDLIGAVYFRDEAGKLTLLEPIKPELESASGQQWELAGATSPVRIQSGAKLLFVVRLANGIDPATFMLASLETKKDIRRLTPSPRGAPVAMRFNVTKFGESSYGLTPATDLPPGEYAFLRKDFSDSYCFGIDAAAR